MKTEQKERQVRKEGEKHVLFELQRTFFGIHILEVSEILSDIHITPVPQASSYTAGMMTVRGEPIVVIDLRKRLGMVPKENDVKTRIIVLKEKEGERLGLLVDGVKEIITIEKANMREPGALIEKIGIKKEILIGVSILEKEPIFILDVSRVIGSEPNEMPKKQAI